MKAEASSGGRQCRVDACAEGVSSSDSSFNLDLSEDILYHIQHMTVSYTTRECIIYNTCSRARRWPIVMITRQTPSVITESSVTRHTLQPWTTVSQPIPFVGKRQQKHRNQT